MALRIRLPWRVVAVAPSWPARSSVSLRFIGSQATQWAPPPSLLSPPVIPMDSSHHGYSLSACNTAMEHSPGCGLGLHFLFPAQDHPLVVTTFCTTLAFLCYYFSQMCFSDVHNFNLCTNMVSADFVYASRSAWSFNLHQVIKTD